MGEYLAEEFFPDITVAFVMLLGFKIDGSSIDSGIKAEQYDLHLAKITAMFRSNLCGDPLADEA